MATDVAEQLADDDKCAVVKLVGGSPGEPSPEAVMLEAASLGEESADAEELHTLVGEELHKLAEQHDHKQFR